MPSSPDLSDAVRRMVEAAVDQGLGEAVSDAGILGRVAAVLRRNAESETRAVA